MLTFAITILYDKITNYNIFQVRYFNHSYKICYVQSFNIILIFNYIPSLINSFPNKVINTTKKKNDV